LATTEQPAALTSRRRCANGQLEPQTKRRPNSDPLLQRDENVASHHDDPQQQASTARPRRHGGAMPQ
jgi:hypothetical protein